MSIISGKHLELLHSIYEAAVTDAFNPDTGEFLVLSHFGEINPSKVDVLLKITESSLLESRVKRKIVRRICSVVIENLQNVSIHSAKDKDGMQRSMVLLTKHAEYFRIMTGNLVLKEDAAVLDDKLRELNNFSLSEIRKLYIETLCNENFSYKGGAGLGFLTVAKKSVRPIEYEIIPLNDQFSYFKITIKIDNKE